MLPTATVKSTRVSSRHLWRNFHRLVLIHWIHCFWTVKLPEVLVISVFGVVIGFTHLSTLWNNKFSSLISLCSISRFITLHKCLPCQITSSRVTTITRAVWTQTNLTCQDQVPEVAQPKPLRKWYKNFWKGRRTIPSKQFKSVKSWLSN